MQFRNSRSLASAPALAAIALTRTDHTRHFRRGQLRLPAMRLGDLLRSLARYLPSSSCPGLMKGRRGGGLSHMLPAWLPPPERGRVGVGVDSTMWSAAVSLSNWRSETPSRLAALADLPLSGGGEEPLASNAIPFGGRERSAKAGVETENNKSHHGEGKGG